MMNAALLFFFYPGDATEHMDKPYWYTKQHDFHVRQSVREMACSFFCHQGFIGIIWAHSLLESIRSDEGLTLETSAFLKLSRW